jgi:hypothetical protein
MVNIRLFCVLVLGAVIASSTGLGSRKQRQWEHRSWPDLVGKTVEEARFVIENDFPGVSIQVVEQHSMVTHDYRTNRVRLFVNEYGIIVSIPRNG